MAISFKKEEVNFPDGKDEAIKKYKNLIIKNAPDYDAFRFRELHNKMGLSGIEIVEIKALNSDLTQMLINSELCTKHGGTYFKLTDKGRELKNYVEPKTPIDWYKISAIIISLLTLYLGYVNYQLKKSQSLSEQELIQSQKTLSESQKSLSDLEVKMIQLQDSLSLLKLKLSLKENKGIGKSKELNKDASLKN